MEGSKLFVIFLLSTDVSYGAENFIRDDKRGERHAYLVSNPAIRLSSAILDSFIVSEPMGCVFRCISHQEYYSVNFAAVSHDGRYMCELLTADKFQISSNFFHSVSLDHYNGIQLPRHQVDSPTANSPPRNDLATNVLATKRSLLATNHQ